MVDKQWIFTEVLEDQCFSSWDNFIPKGHWAMSGDTSGFQNLAGGILPMTSARDAAKHPPMHRTAPTTKNYPIKVSVVLRLRNLY